MNIRERQEKLVEFFNSFDDEMSKYSYLIERGGSLDLIKPEEKDEAHLVDGCQSSVWLLVDTDSNDRLVIRAESDSFVVQGVLSIIIARKSLILILTFLTESVFHRFFPMREKTASPL